MNEGLKKAISIRDSINDVGDKETIYTRQTAVMRSFRNGYPTND